MEVDIDFGDQGSADQTLRSALERLHAKPEVIERYHLHTRCFAAWEFERTKGEGP